METDPGLAYSMLKRRSLLIMAGAALLPGSAAARFHRKFVRPVVLERVLPPAAPKPDISWIALDSNGKEVPGTGYQQDVLRPTASLAKLMTAYLLCRTLKDDKRRDAEHRVFRHGLDTPIRISAAAAATSGSHLGLKPGSLVPLRTLAEAMMSVSANDAATAIGEAIAGSTPAIAGLMNAQARSMGLLSTRFANANGQDKWPPLKPEWNVSNARDMASLAMRLQIDYGAAFPELTHPAGVTYHNHYSEAIEHAILGRRLPGLGVVEGAKTGTGHAGHNEALVCDRGGQQSDRIAIVLMGAASKADAEAHRARFIEITQRAIASIAKPAAKPPNIAMKP